MNTRYADIYTPPLFDYLMLLICSARALMSITPIAAMMLLLYARLRHFAMPAAIYFELMPLVTLLRH